MTGAWRPPGNATAGATDITIGKRNVQKSASGSRMNSRSRASRAPFVVVVLTVLGAGLVGLILLSTVLQAQAFEIARLSTRADALGVQQQELRREVDRLQAPAALAERAIRLGMVPNANPAFLRPSDGEVIGDPEPAEPRSNVTRVDR